MKIMILVLISVFSTLFIFPDNRKPPPYIAIEKDHPLLWESAIGRASFRTNICTEKGMIIMGSNGDAFKDGYFIDNRSGVYFISSHNGHILRQLW